jgi:hypothetical protein
MGNYKKQKRLLTKKAPRKGSLFKDIKELGEEHKIRKFTLLGA